MGINEMSSEFDILYNQVNSNQASSVDEYEKSVFLTKSQDEIVRAYFDPTGNKSVKGFDGGQKRQYDFSTLVKNVVVEQYTGSSEKYDPRSYVYVMPKNWFLALNESVYESVNGIGYIYQVQPISFEQYGVLMQKPYQYPTKKAVWRLITKQVQVESRSEDLDGVFETRACVELIGRFRNDYSGYNPEYRMRYVEKPTPIILANLKQDYEGLSIDGFFGNEVGYAIDANGSIITDEDSDDAIGIPCMLPDAVHHEIVQRAVELATAVYNPQALSAVTGVGNVSSTNIGIIPRQEGR